MKTRIFYFTGIVCMVFFLECCASKSKDPKCNMNSEPGVCMAAIPKYYYNPQSGQCELFTWGGCGDFPFTTMQECEDVCE